MAVAPKGFSLALFNRREVAVPTRLGLAILTGLLALPALVWFRYGEAFLSLTERVPAKILVVEGWVGPEGIRASKLEFERGGYDLIVTSGGNPDPYSEENWQREGWTYAEGAFHQLVRAGVPAERIIAAPAKVTDTARTYESALTVKAALGKLGIVPQSINIFSFGPHARRSKIVYEKACGPATQVGVIAWVPRAYGSGPWWRSSERSIELLVQTVGFFYEVLFNSGRA